MRESQDHDPQRGEARVAHLIAQARKWVERDRYGAALAPLDVAAKVAPTSAAVHEYRGVLLSLREEDTAALAAFSQALSLTQEDEQASVYYHRGLLYGRRGDYASAILDFTLAIRRAPGNHDYREALEEAKRERKNERPDEGR